MNALTTQFRNTTRLGILAISALFVLTTTGCGESEANLNTAEGDALTDVTNDTGLGVDEEWLTIDDLTVDQMATIELQRAAIEGGLVLGKGSLSDELNLIMFESGIDASYTASSTSGAGYAAPTRGICPFLEEPVEGTNNIDCRQLADQAMVKAYSNMDALEQDHPLDSTFNANREENEYWYGEGMVTGFSNETILAVRAIRTMDVCDQAPTPSESAYEEGVERGRQLYIDKLNERFAEVGMTGSYPDDFAQVEVCQADRALLAPASSRAVEEAGDFSQREPLCPDYVPATTDDQSRLAEAEEKYELGLRRGIEDEESLASESVFRIVPCNVGDPLVLDIAGDGVDIQPVFRSEVEFDLFSMGNTVRTAWIQGDDAFLVLDRNQNGTIDNGRELFANYIGEQGYVEVPTGFDHLAIYDDAERGGNSDGLISDADAVFGALQLWQDDNTDGVSQASELHSLTALGVRALALAYIPNHGADRQLTHRAGFVRTAMGTMQAGAPTGIVYDAWLRYGHAKR